MNKNVFIWPLLLLCSFSLTLILFSYDATDPSLHVASGTTIHNLGNTIGAYIADIIFQYIGFAGLLLIVLPCIPLLFKRLYGLKVIILLLLVTSISLLLTLIDRKYGAMLGIILASYLLQYFTFTTLFSITLCITTLSLLAMFNPVLLFTEIAKNPLLSFNSSKENSPTKATTIRFTLPSVTLLTRNNNSPKKDVQISKHDENKQLLERTLEQFGIRGKITKITTGPVVTLYRLQTTAKTARVIGLADDIAQSMQVPAIRITHAVEQNVLEIELPNAQRAIIFLRELLESKAYEKQTFTLPIVLGKDISGNIVILNLVKTPHMLLVGSTGSGKSMTLKAIILSLIHRFTPQECMFIVMTAHTLRICSDLPHLLFPIVTTSTTALTTLEEIVKEMEKRYRAMHDFSVNNITAYNKKALSYKEQVLQKTVQVAFDNKTGKPIFQKKTLQIQLMPYIVAIIDEITTLLTMDCEKVTTAIQRLTQMAHTVGIHLIITTQRPSILGADIKTSFATKISFVVTSKRDSHAILKEQGAEQLLGMGDMLYMNTGGKIKRVHGVFVHNDELQRMMQYFKTHRKQ